ncbi:MAG: hypothetical protein V4721_16470 [Bacteroidota bacterium]
MEKVNLKAAGLTKLTDHLLVVDCEDQKVVFAFGQNIGYISDEEMLLVKKDFFEGGGKSTVHVKQAIKIVEQTYQLRGSITEERIVELEKSVKDLSDINNSLTKEKDKTNAQSLLRSAMEIFQKYPTESNKNVYAEIQGKADAILNPPITGKEKAKAKVAAAPAAEAEKVEAPAAASPVILESSQAAAHNPDEALDTAKKKGKAKSSKKGKRKSAKGKTKKKK